MILIQVRNNSDKLPVDCFNASLVGAMENWVCILSLHIRIFTNRRQGLITGRTDVLLFDPKKDGLVFQKRTALTQAHEVAHMWFGNITTMAWWDYL